MLISLSSLVDETTLYSIKRFFLSKDNDEMGLSLSFFVCTVCLHQAVLCAR